MPGANVSKLPDAGCPNENCQKQVVGTNQVTNPQILGEAILPVTFKDQLKSELAVLNGYVYSNAQSKSGANGVDNPGFLKDSAVGTNDIKEEVTSGKHKQNHKGPFFQCSGKYQWLWQKRMILIVIVTVSIAIVSGIQLYRNTSSQTSTESEENHVDENEHESPLDYISDSNGTINKKVRIFSRKQWLAQPPSHPVNDLQKVPVSLVIIQHSATESCLSQSQCIFQTRYIQMFHIESLGWSDIGYNFLVGGDGDAYEGRGWKKEGSHTLGYNKNSIGVCFIGTFINEPPPENQIAAFHHLMKVGVELGHLTKDYKVLAAKQLQATASPGEAFIRVIRTWEHWAPKP
ncbi:unnamed protein product [Callosobruchus maculatus]|uniref:Peptidoglycan recognition protein family domain-containing protein n=1 Tax=Callosobruchus maculatus TaxID=64391 RepID=A0A653C566_CALMS|nr:unnamed protein product [Callosobruchus maculatus]